MVAGILNVWLVSNLLHRAAQNLADRVFGNRSTTMALLNAATGPILSRTMATHSLWMSSFGRFTPLDSTKEAYGRLPFQLIRDANDGAFRYIFVRRQHFLHAAS